MKKLPARFLLAFTVLVALHGHATETELPLDLIELLGELDDDDQESLSESLVAALPEVEAASSSKKISHPKEVKK